MWLYGVVLIIDSIPWWFSLAFSVWATFDSVSSISAWRWSTLAGMYVGQTDFGEHPVRVMCQWMTWIQLVGLYSPWKVSWIVHRWCIWSVSCGKCAMNFTETVSNENLSACLVYPMQHSLSVSLYRRLHELLVDYEWLRIKSGTNNSSHEF